MANEPEAPGQPAPERPQAEALRARKVWRYRHRLPVRLAHWIIAGCFVVLLMSGLQIFNAHPALYWGNESQFDAPLFAIDPLTGTNHLFGQSWENGLTPYQTALPSWMTIPDRRSLPEGRMWHFLFAWVLGGGLVLYAVWGLVSRHLWRDIVPRGADFRALPASLGKHLRLRFRNAPGRYNPLQKLSYAIAIFVLFPLIIWTGLAMSPGMNAAWPFLADWMGGRQSARTIHFLCATLLALFVVVHVAMALLSGPFNALLGIVLGWKREAPPSPEEDRHDGQ